MLITDREPIIDDDLTVDRDDDIDVWIFVTLVADVQQNLSGADLGSRLSRRLRVTFGVGAARNRQHNEEHRQAEQAAPPSPTRPFEISHQTEYASASCCWWALSGAVFEIGLVGRQKRISYLGTAEGSVEEAHESRCLDVADDHVMRHAVSFDSELVRDVRYDCDL